MDRWRGERNRKADQQAGPALDEREARLRAVCERPDDDSARLEYAEFLEATGDPDDALRAEFIRVQCELARPDLPSARWWQINERKSVLETNCDRWANELPMLDGVRWNSTNFPRGFVWDVWCDDSEAFRRNAAAIFAAAPIQSASFMRLRALAPVLEVPELSRIKRLILDGFGLGPADARALASSSYVCNLTELHLSDNRFGDAGARALGNSTHLTRLDNLDLGQNRIGDDGVGVLAASPVVSSLSHLGLAGNPLTDSGALALASSPHLGRLDGLTLWKCRKIGQRGKQALKARFGDVVSFED